MLTAVVSITVVVAGLIVVGIAVSCTKELVVADGTADVFTLFVVENSTGVVVVSEIVAGGVASVIVTALVMISVDVETKEDFDVDGITSVDEPTRDVDVTKTDVFIDTVGGGAGVLTIVAVVADV